MSETQKTSVSIRQPAQSQVAGDTHSCPYCGKKILSSNRNCQHCGEYLDAGLRQEAGHRPSPEIVETTKHRRDKFIYVLVAFFLGGLIGLHNFYARRYVQGAIQLIIVAVAAYFSAMWVGFVINAIWVLCEIFVVTYDGTGELMTNIPRSTELAQRLLAVFVALLLFGMFYALLNPPTHKPAELGADKNAVVERPAGRDPMTE